ncbi:CRAL-TRIO domain-containing protein [Plectosphaerella plurivora]|uniref:Phosphatidylinositol transfer protein SFH5 n=1 Tax=Plectosphaerella plurivora TaxID=936078 RepID=A0A9P8V1A2_9PEZI|nr:CRAL-TRIO domain-containing protein [Plectosphaerella plurivora]
MADTKPVALPLTEEKPAVEQPAAPTATETAAPEAAAAPVAEGVKPLEVTEAPKPVETKPVEAGAPASEEKKPVAEAPAAPTTDEVKPEEAASEVPAEPPIQQLYAAFKTQTHPEIYGVNLQDPDTHIPSQIIFQKYLNANDGDVPTAKEQLLKTLAWRAEAKPLELAKKTFSKAKFEGLGYVTEYGDSTNPEKHSVFTWNVYGAASDRMTEVFGNLDEFIEWRVALAELALARLAIDKATAPITAENDPYKITQVHDYLSISFLRRSAEVKASSTKTVAVFNQNYPETLREKFFVNVPVLMGFMYAFMKLFVAAKTLKKFHPMSNGASLAAEFAASPIEGLGEKLPAAYGGKGAELKGNAQETALA